MRILILGAGGIGGYFGARLQSAGGDVTFLVRPNRADNLSANGLRVSSVFGDIALTPKVITSATKSDGIFDVIILSCKAYDLDAALDSISPALGPNTVVLPLLNGVAHLDALDARFGRERVLGGVAHISVTMAASGEIEHLNSSHRLIIGSRHTPSSKHVAALAELFAATSIDFTLSQNIEQNMWDKLIFITTLAGATCTMRACVGDILSTISGEAFILGLLEECERVAVKNNRDPNPDQLLVYRNQLTDRSSNLMASMLRDIERSGPTEADHIIGDMVLRADASATNTPILKLAYSHLQAYELTRKRHVQ
jgi:2-dehydropantoate 2-reductase